MSAEPDAGDVEAWIHEALSHRPSDWYLAGEHADRRAIDCLGCVLSDLSPADPHFDTVARLRDLLAARVAAARAPFEALSHEWALTEFPDERTATIMRADLDRMIEAARIARESR